MSEKKTIISDPYTGRGWSFEEAVQDVLGDIDKQYRLVVDDAGSVAREIAQKMAANLKVPTVIFSQRVTLRHVVLSLLTEGTGIDIKNLRSGNLKPEDWPKITRTANALRKTPLVIDADQLFMDDICSRIRFLRERQNVRLAIVDLGWMMITVNKTWDPPKKLKEWQEMFTDLSLELKVKIVLVGDLPRH